MIDPDGITEARHALGRQLAAYRKAASLRQHDLAPLVHYARSTIANVEIGRQSVSRTFWERCDQVLRADGEMIGGYEDLKALMKLERQEVARGLAAERAAKSHELKRRSVLALPLATLSAVVVGPDEPWARLTHALKHPGQLDNLAMEHLEWCTVEFFGREEHTQGCGLAGDLLAHINRLEHLLGGAPAPFQRRLLMTLGETLTLAGWVAWDGKDSPQANELYQRASDAARQAGDGPLNACVLGYRSYLAEADGDLAAARQLLVEAQPYARGQSSAATRSWLAAREAGVDAALAERTPALCALDRATTAYDYAHPRHERSWTGFLTPSSLGSMAVTTYARLNHAALDVVTDSVVASLATTHSVKKTVVLAVLAGAAIQCGRHDRGAELGHNALDQTAARETRVIRQQLHELRLTTNDQCHIPLLAELNDRLVAHAA